MTPKCLVYSRITHHYRNEVKSRTTTTFLVIVLSLCTPFQEEGRKETAIFLEKEPKIIIVSCPFCVYQLI
jgi:hypothetical protein